MEVTMSDLIGKSLGRYQILEQIGEGGMATVYKAHDTRLEADVAVKVIRTENILPSTLERALKRFEREAKALARLNHPNIVRVMDYGEYEGKPYLVMPYFPGGTLKQKMGMPMPWEQAIRLILPIAEALDYAHSQNMIHRDVKPSNILLTGRGQPLLTDFGIAKILEAEEGQTLTSTGMGVGTPEYMSPEQWKGQASLRSDIYSLGVILYELLAGRKPYIADTPADLLLKQATEPLPKLSQFVKGLSPNVENVLFKALERKPEDRYASMAEFSSALEGLLKAASVPTAAPSSTRKESQIIVDRKELKGPPISTTGITITKTATGQDILHKNNNKKTARRLSLVSVFSLVLGLLGIAVVLFLIYSSNISKPQISEQISNTPTTEFLSSPFPSFTPTFDITLEPSQIDGSINATSTPTQNSSLKFGKWTIFTNWTCNPGSSYAVEIHVFDIFPDGSFIMNSDKTGNWIIYGEEIEFTAESGYRLTTGKYVATIVYFTGKLTGDKISQGNYEMPDSTYGFIRRGCWDGVYSGK